MAPAPIINILGSFMIGRQPLGNLPGGTGGADGGGGGGGSAFSVASKGSVSTRSGRPVQA